MRQITTRVLGVNNHNTDGTSRQHILTKYARSGGVVILNHVSSLEGDPNTIEVLLPGAEGKKPRRVGFLPGRVGDKLARYIDAQREVTAVISAVETVEKPPHTSLELKITF